jgi:hypothetical protein
MVRARAVRLRFVLALTSLVLLASAGFADDRSAARPRLAVLVVFDQLRGDYLARWQPLFEKGGFRRLTSEGAWFQNCHYPYAATWTAAGHATLATGCSPDRHGIIANEWYDRRAAKEVSCVRTERYTPVPPSTGEKKEKGAGPHLLLAPTFADVLKDATAGKGRVVSLSLKDRSAILPGGRRPDACYWADKAMRFVTSTYYRDREHAWVRRFNESGAASRWLGQEWQRLRKDVDYVRWSGADDVFGEGTGYRQGRTFPHPFLLGKKGGKRNYAQAVEASPMGNDLLLELVSRAIDAEKLGSRDVPDFLSISFSSNDLVGHVWGPDSQEVLDTTLRSDRIVRDLLALLDQKVGKGRWVLVLSADHGICPVPEVTRARGREARRVVPKALQRAAEEHLDSLYPPAKGEERGKGAWIEAYANGMLYLDRKRIARRGLKAEQVETALAKWAVSRRGIARAYTRKQLEVPALDDALGRRVQRSYFAGRSGDVTLIASPHSLLIEYLTGTTHGSPHAYDTHVPLVVLGAGVKPGVRKDSVSPEQAAVILAHALGMKAPARATLPLPAGLFEKPER